MTVSILVIFFSLFVAVASWYAVPVAFRVLAEKHLAHECLRQKAIVLSYDDGPSRDLTPRLMSLLDGKAQATFFVLGINVKKNVGLIPRLLEAGHEIGSHSHYHVNAWESGPGAAVRDVVQGIETAQIAGVKTTVFRPPYGKMTLATLAISKWHGQRLGWWTIDTKDAQEDEGERKSFDQVLHEIEANGGGVILMHDFDRPAAIGQRDGHADYVVELTRQILKFAEAGGYRLVPLAEVIGQPSAPLRGSLGQDP